MKNTAPYHLPWGIEKSSLFFAETGHSEELEKDNIRSLSTRKL